MALYTYTIQLTEFGGDSGPDYIVFYSTDCTNYTSAGTVTLPNIGYQAEVDLDENTTCVKLRSTREFTNEVISGSAVPTPTPLPLTYRVTLTDKNSSGDTYQVKQAINNDNTFLDLTTIDLESEGQSALIFPSASVGAIELQSQGQCTNGVIKVISDLPQPTPTPTPTPTGPTPTPSSTPAPTPTPSSTPTPTPTPSNTPVPAQSSSLYYGIRTTGSYLGSNVTFTHVLSGEEYTFETTENGAAYYFTSRTTPTTTGDATVVGPISTSLDELTPANGWDTQSWDYTKEQDVTFDAGQGGYLIASYFDSDLCLFVTSSIFTWPNGGGLTKNMVSGSLITAGIPDLGPFGTVTNTGGCVPGVTPTPTPTPTPTTGCFTLTNVYSSTAGDVDVCCAQVIPKNVYSDAATLSSTTAIYTDNTCSTIRTTTTWYTTNFSDYYIWNGLSLQGPYSCPGCP